MDTKTKSDVDVPTKTLMTKTKKDLVDIILRKDSVEKTLRNSLEEAHKECDKRSNDFITEVHKVNTWKQKYDALKNNYEDVCDDFASYKCECKTKLKVCLCVLALIAIIELVIGIILVF